MFDIRMRRKKIINKVINLRGKNYFCVFFYSFLSVSTSEKVNLKLNNIPLTQVKVKLVTQIVCLYIFTKRLCAIDLPRKPNSNLILHKMNVSLQF